MTTRLIVAITCLALSLGGARLYAQDAVNSTAESAENADDNGAGNQAAVPATEQANQAPATNEPAAGASVAASRDPFDYESSEQISEDLSVSFPVDI